MVGKSTSVQQVLAGEVGLSTFVSMGSPASVEILARRGYDPLCIDTEHVAIGPEGVEGLIRAADALGASTLVRVAGIGPEIGRALDSGARGVIVPRVETPEQARACVDLVRYPPEGHRGSGPGRSTAFGKDIGEVIPAANSSIALILQVETQAGLSNAYEIAAVEGVDMVFVGPGDLSVSLGVAWGSEEHTAAVTQILADVMRAGKLGAMFSLTGEDLPQWRALGASFFFVSGDIFFLGDQAEVVRQRALDVLGPSSSTVEKSSANH